MEVLLAVGILAIGLSSVVALLPAGHSMAKRSFITDQASIIAANAAADFVTQGFLRPQSQQSANLPVMFDPLYNPAEKNSVGVVKGFGGAVLKVDGALAKPSSNSYRISQPVSGYLVRGRDDLVYNVPENANQEVTNRWTDGIREYQGKFTWAATLVRPAASSGTGPPRPGENVILTILVFHQRETPPPSSATVLYEVGQFTWSGALVQGRQDKDALRTGAVMLLIPTSGVPHFRRIRFASIDATSGMAFVEFEGGDPPGGPFTASIVPDAVAVLEKTVKIEGTNGYSP